MNEPYGCELGICKMNIQAYADDIVVFCPSATGLRKLLSRLEGLLLTNELEVNVNKTKTVIFSRSSSLDEPKFYMCGALIENVRDYKYLGCMLNSRLSEKSELSRIQSSFNNSVGMFLRKFYSVDIRVKLTLFRSLCLSFYGLELINNIKGCSDVFKKCAVSYHMALKRLLGVPRYFSNHYVCNDLNMFTFKHFVNVKVLKFFMWLISSSSPCLYRHKAYFVNFSLLATSVQKIFAETYGVQDVFDNDFDALMARVSFVQNNENFSSYMFSV